MDSFVMISLVVLSVGRVKCYADTQVQGQSGHSGQGSAFFLMQHVFKLEGKVENQLEQMEEDIEELESKVDKQNGPSNGKDVTVEIETMKSEIESLSEEFKSVKIDNLNLEAEVARLQESNSALREGITALQGSYSELQENNTILFDSNSALQESNSALTEGIAALQGSYSELLESSTILLDSNSELQKAISRLQSKGDGVTYVRWGRTVCPQGSDTVYKGYVGGGYWKYTGAAANWLCLTREPEWGYYDSRGAGAQVYGGEYQFGEHHNDGGSRFFGKNLYEQDAPCVVCRPPRPSVVMIPGRKTCFTGWTLEYSGYLVAGAWDHNAATEFICLDSRPEAESGGHKSNDGKLFYMAEGICGSLKCPPYVNGRELTCVVCSK